MLLLHIATEITRSNHSGKHTKNGKDCLAGTVVNASSMKEQDEIRRELLFQKCPILNAKYPTKIGTSNVRTMFQAGKTQQVVREMKNYEIPSFQKCDGVDADAFNLKELPSCGQDTSSLQSMGLV